MRKSKTSALILSLFLLFLFSSASLNSQSETADAVLEKNQESIIPYVIYGDDKEEIGKGTGFVIGDRVMATAYHLITKAADIEGRNFKGKRIRVDGILAVDKKFDIALLKIRGRSPAMALGNSDELALGKDIFALGGNDVGQLRVDDGTVREILELSPTQRVADSTIVASDTFCGGPICGQDGQVLGVLDFLDDRTRIIIPINALKNMSQSGAVASFSGSTGEDYFETYEWANLAGRSFYALEDAVKAEKFLKKIVTLKPDDLEAHILLASVYTDQRNYSSAVSTYQKIIDLNPNLDGAYFGLGEVYMRMMKWKEAIDPLNKAVELNKDNKKAYFYIGNAYYELREFEKAAEFYKTYLDLNPEDPTEAYQQLGLSYFEIEKFDEAIPAFQEALKANNQDIALNYKLAQSFHKAGRYEEAEQLYMNLAQLSPDDVRIYYNTIVMMYDEAKLPDKAVEAAQKLVDLEPENSDAVFNLGYMLMKQKKFEEAIDVFNRVIELNPGMEYAYLQLGYCHNQLKQYAKAVEVYQRLVKIVPENADAWMGIGIGYMQQKKWDPAVEPLKKVIELRPDNGNAYYNLGICYLNLKDNYSARQVWEQLRNIDKTLAAKLYSYIK
jgi:tetratricopeptide (TPR) repeat protein